MTGAYVRIQKDGTWQNIEIDQLTDKELDQLEKDYSDRGWFWAKFLAKWIREHVGETEDF